MNYLKFRTLATISNIKQYSDINNHWWKAEYLQSWIESFNTGKPIGILELDRKVFGVSIRPDLISKAIRYERLWKEQGTESTKQLGQVRGSTRKPFPQKGRGKARVGTLRAPHFVGGYNCHGPRPHNKSIDIPRKVYDASVRSALSTKSAQDQIKIVDSLELNSESKSDLLIKLQGLKLNGKKIYFLYGDEEPNENLIKASDQFEKTNVFELKKKGLKIPLDIEKSILTANARNISIIPLLEHEIVVMDKTAVEVLEEMYRQ